MTVWVMTHIYVRICIQYRPAGSSSVKSLFWILRHVSTIQHSILKILQQVLRSCFGTLQNFSTVQHSIFKIFQHVLRSYFGTLQNFSTVQYSMLKLFQHPVYYLHHNDYRRKTCYLVTEECQKTNKESRMECAVLTQHPDQLMQPFLLWCVFTAVQRATHAVQYFINHLVTRGHASLGMQEIKTRWCLEHEWQNRNQKKQASNNNNNNKQTNLLFFKWHNKTGK